MSANTQASDIPHRSWVDRLVPPPLRPYARLARADRPIGVWLLVLPCWWGAALASPSWPDPRLLMLFAVGALVMRGAGCTINDIVDRNIDARVARTRDRPIPSGAVSVRQAIVFALILSMIGLMVLIQFNSFTIIVCLLSVALIIIYPFAKRYTYWPQAVLGLTFNWGVLVGWAAVEGQLDAPAFLLYGAAVLWTIAYDTIYAHQDKDDDRLIGVKSTALLFGDRTYRWLMLFFGGTLVLAGISGWWAHMGWPFFAFIALVACHFAWQLSALDLEDPKSCLRVFKSNRAAGLLMFAGIVLGSLYSPLGTG